MRSFTLIETIVAIAVFILALGVVSSLILMAYRTQSYSWQQSAAIDEARRGVETMVKEIREARPAETGNFPIEKAEDKEFIFYSDIDNNGKTERVRYFLGEVNSGSQTQECQTSAKGGSCSVIFSNFFTGTLKSAQIKVSVDGDFGLSSEYAEIFADGTKIGEICKSGCSDCPHSWQGTVTLDVTTLASDNAIQFLIDSSLGVDPNCPYAMKARFEFSWTEDLSAFVHEFKKGVIKPTGVPPAYPQDQEQVTILSSYVRNSPPIFEYFDQNGNKIEEYPARLGDTTLMKVFLAINVDPNRPPQDFELESSVQLRNLKSE